MPTPTSPRPSEGEVLETGRLRIRQWRHEEAPRLLDIQSRLEVVKWLGDGEPVLMKDLAEAHERIDRYAVRCAAPPQGFWAIEVRETGIVAGSALLLELPNAEAAEMEIGWHLHPDSWGHGYATEAAKAVLDRALRMGLPEVYAVTHLGNHASQAVCRRLGMTDLGVVEKWYDEPSRAFVARP